MSGRDDPARPTPAELYGLASALPPDAWERVASALEAVAPLLLSRFGPGSVAALEVAQHCKPEQVDEGGAQLGLCTLARQPSDNAGDHLGRHPGGEQPADEIPQDRIQNGDDPFRGTILGHADSIPPPPESGQGGAA